MRINIGEAEIMDINNLLRGVLNTPSKGLSQPDTGSVRKNNDAKEPSVGSTNANTQTETVTITDTTSRLRQLSQTASQQPEVNSARVAQLRASIADGSYKIRPDVIASRLASFETGLQR
jgi:negative regulator of flagellin synthesis FlgM